MAKAEKVILIAEDEKPLQEALKTKFAKNGFNAIVASNGEEAVKMALDKKPDLILLDIVMPKMDGMDAMNKIRDDEWGKSVPIIMLTNLNSDEEILKGVIKNEVSYYLVKADYKIEDIIGKVKEVLKV